MASATADLTARRTYTVDEVAKMLGISRNSAYSAMRAGELPQLKVGHRILVPKAQFDRLIAGEAA